MLFKIMRCGWEINILSFFLSFYFIDCSSQLSIEIKIFEAEP
jgi:hypothetical protein